MSACEWIHPRFVLEGCDNNMIWHKLNNFYQVYPLSGICGREFVSSSVVIFYIRLTRQMASIGAFIIFSFTLSTSTAFERESHHASKETESIDCNPHAEVCLFSAKREWDIAEQSCGFYEGTLFSAATAPGDNAAHDLMRSSRVEKAWNGARLAQKRSSPQPSCMSLSVDGEGRLAAERDNCFLAKMGLCFHDRRDSHENCPSSFSSCGDDLCVEYTSRTSWFHAFQECRELEGYLLDQSAIPNQMEEDTSDDWHECAKGPARRETSFWGNSSDLWWQWTDGSPVFVTKWGENEPREQQGNCVALRNVGRHTVWEATECDAKLPYLCQIPTDRIGVDGPGFSQVDSTTEIFNHSATTEGNEAPTQNMNSSSAVVTTVLMVGFPSLAIACVGVAFLVIVYNTRSKKIKKAVAKRLDSIDTNLTSSTQSHESVRRLETPIWAAHSQLAHHLTALGHPSRPYEYLMTGRSREQLYDQLEGFYEDMDIPSSLNSLPSRVTNMRANEPSSSEFQVDDQGYLVAAGADSYAALVAETRPYGYDYVDPMYDANGKGHDYLELIADQCTETPPSVDQDAVSSSAVVTPAVGDDNLPMCSDSDKHGVDPTSSNSHNAKPKC